MRLIAPIMPRPTNTGVVPPWLITVELRNTGIVPPDLEAAADAGDARRTDATKGAALLAH